MPFHYLPDLQFKTTIMRKPTVHFSQKNVRLWTTQKAARMKSCYRLNVRHFVHLNMYITGTSNPRKIYASIGAIVAWLAIALQLYVSLINRKVPVPETFLRFFSYFTILTNIMVALSYTAVWMAPAAGWMKRLTRVSSLTAVAVYIVMVGIIYNTVLRALYDPEGLPYLVDRTLHTVIPLSFILFWLLFVPKASLQWKYALLWLWYPVLYILYIIVLGALTGFYPYPFADVSQLGYSRALLNGLGITGAFFIFGLLFVALGRGASRKF